MYHASLRGSANACNIYASLHACVITTTHIIALSRLSQHSIYISYIHAHIQMHTHARTHSYANTQIRRPREREGEGQREREGGRERRAHKNTHTHTLSHTHTHTHTHTHRHIHTQKCFGCRNCVCGRNRAHFRTWKKETCFKECGNSIPYTHPYLQDTWCMITGSSKHYLSSSRSLSTISSSWNAHDDQFASPSLCRSPSKSV